MGAVIFVIHCRIANIWKKSKAGGRRLWRKTQYHGKELAMRLEKWRHR